MPKPAIISVDDDAAVSAAIGRDLRSRYASDYRVLPTTSGTQALDLLASLELRGQPVALIVSDQKMPEMTGVQFLEKAKEHCPGAKLALLTAYADTDAAIKAINDIGLDYYLMKPWTPPAERLFPVLDDLLHDWRRANPTLTNEVRVVGHKWSERCHEIRTFLTRNHVHYTWLDVERDEEARRLQELADASPSDLPLVLVPDKDALRAPSTLEVASALGLRTSAENVVYDLCIIGAGPAGLAAAVYGASEGLKTLLIERDATGGQAGMSSQIENYLGFPNGVSGADLARRATALVKKFGAEILSAQDVVEIRRNDPYRVVVLADGTEIPAYTVLIASGMRVRQLDAPGVAELAGAGVYYGSALSEAAMYRGRHVYVVGGANSAGQGAMFFSRYAKQVTMLVRGANLEASMSRYLIDRIRDAKNVDVLFNTRVAAAHGNGKLERLTLADAAGNERDVDADAVFIFIGSAPMTEMAAPLVERDAQGFILTGRDLMTGGNRPKGWTLNRDPFLFETSVPGVFAAGDARRGSGKRVAAAVGEGSATVSMVHEYLETV